MNKVVFKEKESRIVRQRRIAAELIEVGMAMFCENGFEATTVVAIAEQVGISRRTFFRYFDAKDDLVFHWLDEQGELINRVLRARPENERPELSMQQAWLALATHLDSEDNTMLSQTQLIFSESSLRRRYHEENEKWERKFVGVLQRQKTMTEQEVFTLLVSIATVTTAFVRAIQYWSHSDKRSSLLPWVKQAFATFNNGVEPECDVSSDFFHAPSISF